MGSRLLNGALFYIGWFVCLEGAVKGWPNIALLITMGLVVIYLLSSDHRRLDLLLIAVALGFGAVIETAFIQASLVQYMSPNPFSVGIVPLWILGIYALLGTSLNGSFFWLDGRPLLAGFLGGVGAPFSYWVGYSMGAVEFLTGLWPAMIVIGIVWAFVMPALFAISDSLQCRMQS